MLQVEADFVKAFFANKVLALGPQVTPVDVRIDELARVRFQVTTAFDSADTLEAQGVPDAA
jgi:hypothetical protein